jgi:hypothetical protein
MKKYFYSDGTNNFGPYTIEELKEKGITRETSVWFHELGGWKKAGTVQELDEIFAFIPPPIQQQHNYNQKFSRKASTNNTIDILALLSIAYWLAFSLVGFVIDKVVDNVYDSPVLYFFIWIKIIFAVVPIVFALTVRNKTLKIIAIILSALISIYMLYINIDWLISVL